jgi:RNA polymerase primary sigma factor
VDSDPGSPDHEGVDRSSALRPEERASLLRTARRDVHDRRLGTALGEPRGGRAIAPTPERYVEDALGGEPLSPDEEERLARAAAAGDQRARARLIAAGLPRLVAAARRYAGGPTEFTDLIQEGVRAILEALVRFDPTRGTPFWAYATPWVRGAMARLAQDQRRALRLPPRAMTDLAGLKEAEVRLSAASGSRPTLAAIADSAGVGLARAEAILNAARPPRSIGEPLGLQDEGLTLGDVLADPRAEAAYEEVLDRTDDPDLEALLGVLSERERRLLERRYGLDGGEEESLAAIGRRLGVSRERARQLEERALAKMRRARA